MDASSRSGKSRGLTLIETLVTIGIIGLLIGLTLPAVHRAREQARNSECLNHLRQLGLAIHAYASVHTLLPSPYGRSNFEKGQLVDLKRYSLHTQILPYLDQASLYHSINFDVALQDSFMTNSSFGKRGAEANFTAMSYSVAQFLCNSDPEPHNGFSGVSYRANLGSERWHVSINGPFMNVRQQLSSASCSDGASFTAAMSEKLVGSDRLSESNRNQIMRFSKDLGLSYSLDEAARNCSALSDSGEYLAKVGLTWMVGDLTQANYNHGLLPNSRFADCAAPSTNPVSAITAARSFHVNHVNILMLDGAVRSVQDSVALPVWRGLGTRDGGEIFSSNDARF